MRSLITTIIILAVVGLSAIILWQGITIPPEPGSKDTVLVDIPRGTSAKEIAYLLEEQGVVRYPAVFRTYVVFKGVSGKLQAGEYELSLGMAMPAIVKQLVAGSVFTRHITILEGWNVRDVAAYFAEEGIATEDEVYALTGTPLMQYAAEEQMYSWRQAFPELLADKPDHVSLEGYLFPDTYEISTSATPKDMIRMMLENTKEKLTPEIREEIARQEKSIFEVIILASLLEKEVPTKRDKQIVAGVLQNRIAADMLLQVDATVVYITDKWDGPVLREETKIESPYNTYVNKGLPVGPITNPGLESIEAALNPIASSYMYYLSARDGTTIFSRTLEEHNAAKARYLR